MIKHKQKIIITFRPVCTGSLFYLAANYGLFICCHQFTVHHYPTLTKHHHHVGLQHTTSLHQVLLHTDLTILTPKNLIITHF